MPGGTQLDFCSSFLLMWLQSFVSSFGPGSKRASFAYVLPLLKRLGQPGAHRLLCLPVCSLDLRKWLGAPRGLRWELSGLQDSRPHKGTVSPFTFYGTKQFTRQSRCKRRHGFLMGGVSSVFMDIKNCQWPGWHRNSPSPPVDALLPSEASPAFRAYEFIFADVLLSDPWSFTSEYCMVSSIPSLVADRVGVHSEEAACLEACR